MSMTIWNNDCKCNTVEGLDGRIGDVLAVGELEDTDNGRAEASQPLGVHDYEDTEVYLLHRALEHPTHGDAEQDSAFHPRAPT
jgi:hypothetical protein